MYPPFVANLLKKRKDVITNLLRKKKDVLAQTLVLCFIFALIIWVLSLLDGLTSVDNDVRTSFLTSMNVSAIEVTEKASCTSEHFCDLEGDIRVDAKSFTIYVMTHNEMVSHSANSWVIRPYPRFYLFHTQWIVKLMSYSEEEKISPKCTEKHYSPAILFSTDEFSLNHYHWFTDVIFPLYMTSFGYTPDIHFLVTDYADWFVPKTHTILRRWSQYPLIDIDNEKERVHCFRKLFVGLKFHGDLIVNKSSPEYAAGVSMQKFRRFLRDTYSLERQIAIEPRLVNVTRPRLMIMSRKSSRILLNEDEISRVANEVGFNVVITDGEQSANQSRFAQLVNSCDVLMGVHGAGLTNMLFLPDNAVSIQMLPFGPLEWWALQQYRDPLPDMNITYLEYRISVEESSLSKQYAPDDPIIADPYSFYAKGWVTIKRIYLTNITFTIDIERIKGTLVEAMKILQH
uniref:GT61_3 n=1 Tax=Plantago ovata TaxID=185002 RepID=S5RRW7_PLAOV|nr:GT61_3 [Plantago ovata]